MIRRAAPLLFASVVLGAGAVAPAAPRPRAEPTLDDYRHYRALSIDLLGRAPTRAELGAFEQPGFDLDAWIDARLAGPGYVERLQRIYMDLLRLEVGPAFQFAPQATTLHRQTLIGPDRKPVHVYYRHNQRRARPETDGEFCLSLAETGLVFPNNQAPRGTAKPVTKKALDAATVLVRPWWLYQDYRDPSPHLRYGRAWSGDDVGYTLVKELVFEPDGTTPTAEVRVCKEEAQTADTGHVYATGRAPAPKGAPIPYGRLRPLPGDDGYTKPHAGDVVSCRGAFGAGTSIDCGCGVGLEHCLPGDGFANDPRAFALPTHAPLGIDGPTASTPQNVSSWSKFWWSQEAQRFMGHVFGEDRDFRELLTARYTFVNGPLAEFYRSGAPSSCCGREKTFRMPEEPEPLFDPRAVPADLRPQEAGRWERVADRGPHAAGLLTMPAFLTKYASRRARGAALYTAFLCKSFVAESHADLPPSKEPNLMIREGCSTCHATLEPLAAWFSRVEEADWVFLPPAQFPVESPLCKLNAQGKAPGFCGFFYDPAFSDGRAGKLRGAYASPEHAEGGPAGAGADIAARPELGSCAVERVASSFLGRPIRDEDAPLLASLGRTFVGGGYRLRPLVGALVRSPAYLRANNDSADVRRQEAR
jgi:hypothetical protein